MDMTNYRFRLIDGLSLVSLNDNYPWILESEIRNAIIGKDENGIVITLKNQRVYGIW